MIAVKVARATDLKIARDAAQQAAHGYLSAEATERLILAVSEIVTNALLYAVTPQHAAVMIILRGSTRLRIMITDRGSGFTVPRAFIHPPPPAEGGRGLSLVQQICDEFRLHSTAAGTTALLWFKRAPTPA